MSTFLVATGTIVRSSSVWRRHRLEYSCAFTACFQGTRDVIFSEVYENSLRLRAREDLPRCLIRAMHVMLLWIHTEDNGYRSTGRAGQSRPFIRHSS